MYFKKTPKFIQNLFPNFVWSMPKDEKVIYLTFDDGPIPEITEWVLDTLRQFNAKGTFFCVGENIKKYPHIYQRILAEDHLTGNHTYNHLSGWTTDNVDYYHNIRKCASKLNNSILFRPPYGRIKPQQARFIQRHYSVIMWDVLSGDFDPNISEKECLYNVTSNTENGSIIVFHDSHKAQKNLYYVLPIVLKYYSELGYRFETLESVNTLIKNKNQTLVG